MKKTTYSLFAAVLFGLLLMSANLLAGTFKTITIDGDFSDWVGVPILTTDTTADGNPVDFVTLYAANDDDNVYLRIVFDAAAAVNGTNTQVFIALDNDNNPATGFDIFSLGIVGSEVGWQNDFPFEQSNSQFNTGNGITDGGAIIAPFNSVTIQQEIALSRNATFTVGGGSIFPNDTFALAMYTSGATVDDFIGKGVYTIAVPEPQHYSLGVGAVLALVMLLRRRR